jgi:hypothetical protein
MSLIIWDCLVMFRSIGYNLYLFGLTFWSFILCYMQLLDLFRESSSFLLFFQRLFVLLDDLFRLDISSLFICFLLVGMSSSCTLSLFLSFWLLFSLSFVIVTLSGLSTVICESFPFLRISGVIRRQGLYMSDSGSRCSSIWLSYSWVCLS